MTERINDLRVALSSIKVLARDGSRKDASKMLNTIYKTARRALERDLSRVCAHGERSEGMSVLWINWIGLMLIAVGILFCLIGPPGH
jgi:hypothetical protein